MIQPPSGMGLFEFVVLAKMRTVQLMRAARRGWLRDSKPTTIAQLEIAAGQVAKVDDQEADARRLAVYPPRDVAELGRRDLDAALAVAWTPPWR